MLQKNFNLPAIQYTASVLESYASSHGIESTPEQWREQLEHSTEPFGTELGQDFDPSVDIPPTIPKLLGRLAVYDQGAWYMRWGVVHNSCAWLKLKDVSPTDERIDTILAILGAKKEHAIIHEESFIDGRYYGAVPFTEHHYIEAINYAIQVHHHYSDRDSATHVGFMLPSLDPKLDLKMSKILNG